MVFKHPVHTTNNINYSNNNKINSKNKLFL